MRKWQSTIKPNMDKAENYYTPAEVSAHNTPGDCWVSFHGKVYNLTSLCEKYAGDILVKPIVAAAGKDISHWFDKETGNVKTYIHPVTGCEAPYVPMGRFIHIPPPFPRSDWANNFGRPWWTDSQYIVGTLTAKTRQIRIVNMVTLQEQVIEACCEESIDDILKRYELYNSHARSYTWKFNGELLNMEQTLEENGIVDESDTFFDLKMDKDKYLPAIQLYYNDDLTEA